MRFIFYRKIYKRCPLPHNNKLYILNYPLPFVESMNTTTRISRPIGAVDGLAVGNNETTDMKKKVVL
jgi:hypothetical protein